MAASRDPGSGQRRDPSREPLVALPPVSPSPRPPLVGVIASQGGFASHQTMLTALGAEVRLIRVPEQVEGVDALVIPGGESTTIMRAIARDGLEVAIRRHAELGGAVLGTCAGMIVLDRDHLGLLDVRCRRNAFGRQSQSFEADIDLLGAGPDPLRCVFIRAPWVEDLGERVEVLASWDRHPVAVREGRVIACAFHPELTDDPRFHALFMSLVDAGEQARTALPTNEEE